MRHWIKPEHLILGSVLGASLGGVSGWFLRAEIPDSVAWFALMGAVCGGIVASSYQYFRSR